MKKLTSILCLLFAVSTRAQPSSPNAASVPENLGLGLRQLASLEQQDQSRLRDTLNSSQSIMSDSNNRVIVNIYLDGTRGATDLGAELIELGLDLIAIEPTWRNGIISAALPVSQAATVAQLPGIRSVILAHRPKRHVGVVTAESSVVERAADVNTPGIVTPAGILGRNISVGIVSDSYDKATGVPRASVAVASGDLPGPGNPDGYGQPVVVLSDDASSGVSDEGRGMAEIVHDIAPAAKICFAAAGATQVTFANAIRNLRTNSLTRCDIITDDISFPDEPFFSDGVVAQAVEDVVTSTSLAGKKVSFFSASGNNAGGYSADANIVSVSNGMSHRGNLNFSQVPSALYAGGFQNFSATSTPSIVMSVTTGSGPAHEISFQWDDPFNVGHVTTDYNLLVFNATGLYLGNLSGTDNNQSTDQPVEIVDLNASTTYQLVISLRTVSPPTATHLRFVTQDGDTTGPLITSTSITIFGHAAAADANCIAAYAYDNNPNLVANYNANKLNPPPGPYRPLIESFNAVGGNIPFYFNSQGQRLATPEIRVKPDFAAADGVDTSFFPADPDSDYDNDGFPNFFGTSAAAPNAAAFAALLLEAAGGPSSLTPAQVQLTLRQSAFAHDIDQNFAQASTSSATSSVLLTALGDDSNASASNPNFFTATFNGQPNERLNQLTIDLTNASLVFDQDATLGLPFTLGQNAGNVSVTSSLSSDSRILTLTFGNTFSPGKSISFGIDRDFVGINADGNAADYLGGATITAVTDGGQISYGAFVNQLGKSFAPTDGYGLLDAKAAVQQITGINAAASGVPANVSTRGLVGTGGNVLIGGVIISGNGSKKIVIRALGPSLPVAGALADPTIELVDANGQTFFDDNWQDDPDQAAQISASTLAPHDPRESAIIKTLAPGNYTAIVRGVGDSTGIGLVEVYDVDNQPLSAQLANIATRGQVQPGDNVLIAGFILSRASTQVAVRALGPSLIALGVADALADPTVELYDVQGNLLTTNDNWQQDPFQAMQLQTVGLAPTNGLESALITSLNPANYTLVVRGAHNLTGVALVEVFDLP